MGKQPLYLQMGAGVEFAQRSRVIPPGTEAVHPGVYLDMDPQAFSAAVQEPGVFRTRHRLGQAIASQQRDRPGTGPAQHQNVSPDAAPAQTGSFCGGGHGEGPDAGLLTDAGAFQVAVSVGVGLQHRRECASLRQQAGQDVDIVPQGGGIQLDPGPAPFRLRALSGDQRKGSRQQTGKKDHRQIVEQAVFNEQRAQAKRLGPAADEQNAERMEQIHRGRPTAQLGTGRQIQTAQPAEQKENTKRQREVECVKARKVKLLYKKSFGQQKPQREQQPGGIPAISAPVSPTGKPAAQQ